MIIACDLDGTLTDGRGVISAENTGALRWAKEHGATCILATSRPSRCLDLPTRQRALFDCIITCDGAERSAPEPTGVHLPLSPSDIHRAWRALQDAHITGAYAVELGTSLGHEESYTGWPATDTGVPARTGPFRELCGQAPVARIFFRPDIQGAAALLATAADLTAAAGDSIACTVWEQPEAASVVQFSSRTATKGNAVRAWLADTGRTAQRLIAFGDQLNDLSMLELADDAFAVGDAHPYLRQRYPHLPNADSAAVGRGIRRMLETMHAQRS
ncbi:MAG: HAD hydrolase family protein [Streptosporangiaceae bacterium]